MQEIGFDKSEREKDRAVSPVIGVILMVAITVILASVIGAFVLGLGGNIQSQSPSMSFSCNDDGYPVVQAGTDYEGTVKYDGNSYDSLSAGDVLDNGSSNSGSVTWESENGEQSAILFEGCN